MRSYGKIKFRVNWTNNSIKYSLKKRICVNAMENAVPFTQGLHLKKFEYRFKKYLGTDTYAVANGSNALDLTVCY